MVNKDKTIPSVQPPHLLTKLKVLCHKIILAPSFSSRPDKIYLTMTLLVKDLYAVYSWKRKKLK